MRIAIRMIRLQTNQAQQFLHARLHGFTFGQVVDSQRLADNLAHVHAGVQRCERILEDDLYFATQCAQFAAGTIRMLRPSNHTSPLVCGSRRRMTRPIVVFPEPDSPTKPSVSPALIPKSHPVDRFNVADMAFESNPREWGSICRGSLLSSRLAVMGLVSIIRRRPLSGPFTSGDRAWSLARSSYKKQRATWPAPKS